MKEEKYRDNRGNVVLLTVIAIVTMVIVLVGATFAYLASNIEGSKSANINATTNAGSDLFLITPGADLVLTANENNFGPTDTNLSVNSTATVLFQTTNTTAGGVTKNYKVDLDVVTNNFEYTSGKCYNKPTGANAVIDGITSKTNCTSPNVWASTNGTDYACYDGTNGFTRITSAAYSNQLSCLSKTGYMWELDEIAELVLDLYRDDTTKTDSASCTAVGVCVNQQRQIDNSKTTSTACEASLGTWLPNVWEDNICYHLVVAQDITTIPDNSQIPLIANVAINADMENNGGTTMHYYKPFVTFVNFSHNQIKNGQKSFNASLTFTLITE